MVETFQTTLFPPTSLRWAIGSTVVTGGQPISGPAPSPDISGGGWWTAAMTIKTRAQAAEIRQWRAQIVRLRSGAVPIVVPCYDIAQPWPSGAPAGDPLVPHSDGSPFSDGTRYSSQLINFQLVGDTALRATSMQVRRMAGGILKGGEFFTVTGETYGDRLHVIGSIDAVDDDLFTVSFAPPLREDYEDGTTVDFQNPRCTMKVSGSALDGLWPQMQPPFRGQPSIAFDEWMDALP